MITCFKQEMLIFCKLFFDFVLSHIIDVEICMSDQYYWFHGQWHEIFCSNVLFYINFISVLLVTQLSHSSIMAAVAFSTDAWHVWVLLKALLTEYGILLFQKILLFNLGCMFLLNLVILPKFSASYDQYFLNNNTSP